MIQDMHGITQHIGMLLRNPNYVHIYIHYIYMFFTVFFYLRIITMLFSEA